MERSHYKSHNVPFFFFFLAKSIWYEIWLKEEDISNETWNFCFSTKFRDWLCARKIICHKTTVAMIISTPHFITHTSAARAYWLPKLWFNEFHTVRIRSNRHPIQTAIFFLFPFSTLYFPLKSWKDRFNHEIKNSRNNRLFALNQWMAIWGKIRHVTWSYRHVRSLFFHSSIWVLNESFIHHRIID